MAAIHIRETKVYKVGFDLAMRIYEISKLFPKEERYSLTDQIRRSSWSVCVCLAESWRKKSTKLISFPKYLIQIWKIRKRRPGLNLRWHAAI